MKGNKKPGSTYKDQLAFADKGLYGPTDHGAHDGPGDDKTMIEGIKDRFSGNKAGRQALKGKTYEVGNKYTGPADEDTKEITYKKAFRKAAKEGGKTGVASVLDKLGHENRTSEGGYDTKLIEDVMSTKFYKRMKAKETRKRNKKEK